MGRAPEGIDLVKPILAGVLVSVGLWLLDLLQLSGFGFAGVTDHAAANRVLAVTEPALLALEAKLFFLHLLVGAALGFLFGSARVGGRPLLRAFALTLATFVAALLGTMGHYPQLFSDRFWLSGGFPAWIQRTATHGLGPFWFDLALGALLLAGLAPPLLRGARLVAIRGRALRKPAIAAASTSLLLILVAFRPSRPGGPAPDVDGRPANLLVLASDSLRSDRIEDDSVMPFTASRIASGSLYRYAVTPIARTYPAWVSMLTGTEPRTHGVRHMFPMLESRRDVGPTLFTELRDRGYFTFAVSDFAGDIFPGFAGGFESLDTPHLNVDTLAQSSALARHTWSLAFLRVAPARRLFPYWRNLPSLADPEWVVDGALRQVAKAGSRPYAGVVFFSTAHFPYVAPYPDYLRGGSDYRGRYLYHVPPVQPEEAPDDRDIEQIRARYDAALTAVDRAMERLRRELEGGDTVWVVTSDHGEELYEQAGIAGHGDTIRHLRSQAVPVFLEGPRVPVGVRSDDQVRTLDLPATVLSLLDPARGSSAFGQGTTLLASGAERPICVETGIWFWPGRPLGLRGKRLDYPGISELLKLEPRTREMVLASDQEQVVENAKERGLILGRRLYREQLTPGGQEKEIVLLSGPRPVGEEVDLERAFQERCVEGDENLRRLYDAVVFERRREGT